MHLAEQEESGALSNQANRKGNDWTTTDYLVGAGIQVNLLKDRSLGLRLDYSVHDAKTRVESWDSAALSILYRF